MYKFTQNDLLGCLYWNFIYHPSNHMYVDILSSEVKKWTVKTAKKNNWIVLDKNKTKEFNVKAYVLTNSGKTLLEGKPICSAT